MKITKILVPVDFTESCVHAFHAAKNIAARSEAEVHLVHYCSTLSVRNQVAVETEELLKEKSQRMQGFIKQHCQIFSNRLVTEKGSVGFAHEVILGMAGDEIPDYVGKHGIDLVVMGRRSNHGAVDKFLGSVSSAVIDRAGCPVLLIPMPCNLDEVRHIAFCSHEDSISGEHLDYGIYWSGLFRAGVHYVHAGDTAGQGEKIFGEIRRHLGTAQRVPMDYRFVHLGRETEEELNRYAASHQIDLFITVHRKRTFIESIFHRSFSMSLSHVTRSPLLVIH